MMGAVNAARGQADGWLTPLNNDEMHTAHAIAIDPKKKGRLKTGLSEVSSA
jgi:hypothetical protein